MSINWVEIVAVAAPSLLGGGVLVAVVEGLFRNPEKRANVASAYTKVGLDLLRESRDANKRLESANARLAKENARLSTEVTSMLGEMRRTRVAMELCSTELTETRQELTAARHVIRALVDAIDRAVPVMQQASGDEMRVLAEAALAARRTLNGHA